MQLRGAALRSLAGGAGGRRGRNAGAGARCGPRREAEPGEPGLSAVPQPCRWQEALQGQPGPAAAVPPRRPPSRLAARLGGRAPVRRAEPRPADTARPQRYRPRGPRGAPVPQRRAARRCRSSAVLCRYQSTTKDTTTNFFFFFFFLRDLISSAI